MGRSVQCGWLWWFVRTPGFFPIHVAPLMGNSMTVSVPLFPFTHKLRYHTGPMVQIQLNPGGFYGVSLTQMKAALEYEEKVWYSDYNFWCFMEWGNAVNRFFSLKRLLNFQIFQPKVGGTTVNNFGSTMIDSGTTCSRYFNVETLWWSFCRPCFQHIGYC